MRWTGALFAALLVLTGCQSTGTAPAPEVESTGAGASSQSGSGSDGSGQADDAAGWDVAVVSGGLEHVWGLAELPDGQLLITERPGRISIVSGGQVWELDADLGDVYAEGEGGLMGLALSPKFTADRTFYTCLATNAGDVQIVPWRLSDDGDSAQRLPALVTGIPLNDSGRHSGCRLRIGPDDMLYAGVGDSAVGTIPQDLTVLGGKVLRIDPATGQPPPDNPFIDADNPSTRLIYTYGHRNVQGLAVQPSTGAIYSVEHGPTFDDEVNLLEPGANYGWNPLGSKAYDESVPMTDESIDGAVPAVWSSGESTIATSGAAFLQGAQWGKNESALAIAALKGTGLYLVDVDDATPVAVSVPALDGTYGRLRTVEPASDGSIYVTTSNGEDDKILRVTG